MMLQLSIFPWRIWWTSLLQNCWGHSKAAWRKGWSVKKRYSKFVAVAGTKVRLTYFVWLFCKKCRNHNLKERFWKCCCSWLRNWANVAKLHHQFVRSWNGWHLFDNWMPLMAEVCSGQSTSPPKKGAITHQWYLWRFFDSFPLHQYGSNSMIRGVLQHDIGDACDFHCRDLAKSTWALVSWDLECASWQFQRHLFKFQFRRKRGFIWMIWMTSKNFNQEYRHIKEVKGEYNRELRLRKLQLVF